MQARELRMILYCCSRLASKYYSISEGSGQGTQLFLVTQLQTRLRNWRTQNWARRERRACLFCFHSQCASLFHRLQILRILSLPDTSIQR